MKAGIFCALLLVFLLPAVFSRSFAAEIPDTKTVRVASDDSGLFLVLDKNGEPVSGYAYEFIETIAAYSGWKVEYVPGYSFASCLQMLENGEADLFYDISYSPEREDRMLFPDLPMGSEEYYLYCLSNNRNIHAMDYASYDGKRVGVTAGTLEVEALKTWAENKGISLEFVEFDSLSEKEAALEAGEIDLDLEINMLANRDFSALDRISGDSYYLVVNKERTDLLSDINSACAKNISINRKFFDHLIEKYFSQTLVSKSLTDEETEWVSEHDTLTIGYLNNYLPFSFTDKNGEPAGMVRDLVPLMLGNIGLRDAFRIEYVGFDDNEDMYISLDTGAVDCIFPVCGNMNFAISKNAFFSSDVIGIAVDLAYRDTYTDETTAVIAVNGRNQLQDYYTNYYYPDSEIIYFDTIEECLDAVLNGKAGCTILNGMRTAELLRGKKYTDIHTVRLPDNAEFSVAVRTGNSALLSLVNRSISNTDDSEVVTLSYHYLSLEEGSFSLVDFFRTHPEDLCGLLAFFLMLVLVTVLIGREKEKKANTRLQKAYTEIQDAHRTLSENNSRMMVLEDDLESLYDVELDSGNYEVFVRNQSFSDDIITRMVNGNEFFEDTLDNVMRVVSPEDRESVIRVLNRDHIRKTLAEDSSVDLYYRLVSDEKHHLYRMRILYKDGEKSHIIVGVFNAEAEMAAKLKDERLRDNLIQQMIGNDGLFLIDCVHDTRRTIHDNTRGSVNYSDTESYSEAFGRYIDNCVAMADSSSMNSIRVMKRSGMP